jgi:RNA polymerase sigma-70 factor (ECF subfamily)
LDTKQVYLECKDRLLLIIRRGVPEETDAEDVLHNVFSRFFLHPPNHIPPDQIKFYLIRCATNAIAEWWRKHQYHEKAQDAVQIELPGVYDITPRVEAIKQEDLIRLQAGIAALPDRQQQALSLHYFGEYPYPEIAALMDCSEATVRSHIRHGITQLQELFAKEFCPVSKGA